MRFTYRVFGVDRLMWSVHRKHTGQSVVCPIHADVSRSRYPKREYCRVPLSENLASLYINTHPQVQHAHLHKRSPLCHLSLTALLPPPPLREPKADKMECTPLMYWANMKPILGEDDSYFVYCTVCYEGVTDGGLQMGFCGTIMCPTCRIRSNCTTRNPLCGQRHRGEPVMERDYSAGPGAMRPRNGPCPTRFEFPLSAHPEIARRVLYKCHTSLTLANFKGLVEAVTPLLTAETLATFPEDLTMVGTRQLQRLLEIAAGQFPDVHTQNTMVTETVREWLVEYRAHDTDDGPAPRDSALDFIPDAAPMGMLAAQRLLNPGSPVGRVPYDDPVSPDSRYQPRSPAANPVSPDSPPRSPTANRANAPGSPSRSPTANRANAPGSPPRSLRSLAVNRANAPDSPPRSLAVNRANARVLGPLRHNAAYAFSKPRSDAAPDEPLYVHSEFAGSHYTRRELGAKQLMQYWLKWGGPPAFPPHLEQRGFGAGAHLKMDPYNILSAQEWVVAAATRLYWKRLAHTVARRSKAARVKEARLQAARAGSGVAAVDYSTEEFDDP
jgi:hypothetical protein